VRLVERLKLGQAVEVTLDHPPRAVPGQVTEIVSEIDPAARTQTVKIQLDQGDLRLLPGTFGRLWVETDPRPSLFIPAAAVTRAGQLELVRVAADGRARVRLVRTGPARGDRVEVLSGLRPGEQVVVAAAGTP
jgi:multidrug efflux pump subunit AcrA (membrane-fusion protein)